MNGRFPGGPARVNLPPMPKLPRPKLRPRPEADDDALLPGPPAPPSSKRPDDRPPEPLDAAHRDAVLEGLDQMKRGDLASDDEIAAIYGRAGL